MAKKGWDSDDELLEEMGGGINAFPSVKDEEYDEDELLGNSDDDAAGHEMTLEGLEDLDDNDVIELEVLDVDQDLGEDDGVNQQAVESDLSQNQSEEAVEENVAGYDHDDSQTDYTEADTTNEDMSTTQPESQQQESDSESDEEEEGHRERFKSERSNIITLTSSTSRTSASIPDTLELSQDNQAELEEYTAKQQQRPGGQKWQRNSSRTWPAQNNRGPGGWHTPRQPWGQGQGKGQVRHVPPRMQPYPHHQPQAPMQNNVPRRPLGLLGARPVVHQQQHPPMPMQPQQQQQQQQHQHRTMHINPNFKGQMHLPQQSWETPAYGQSFNQHQPQQQHSMQHAQQSTNMQAAYVGAGLQQGQNYNNGNSQAMAGRQHYAPQQLQAQSPPGSMPLQHQQEIGGPLLSDPVYSPHGVPHGVPHQVRPAMDTDMRQPVHHHHHQQQPQQVSPYQTSPPQPHIVRREPRFAGPQQFQQQSFQQQQQQQQFQQQLQPRNMMHQQPRFRAPQPQHFVNNGQIRQPMQAGRPIQTVVHRQVKEPVPGRMSAIHRLGPVQAPGGQPGHGPRPQQQTAAAKNFQQRSPATVRPRAPPPQKQPPVPKQPTAEEIEEEKRRLRRLQRFGTGSGAGVTTAQGKINLKRISTGEAAEAGVPAKLPRPQPTKIVNYTSTEGDTLTADQILQQKIEEQKQKRKEALAMKERNRRLAAGPRRAELQQKLAEQGKSLADVEGTTGVTAPPAGMPVQTLVATPPATKTIKTTVAQYKQMIATRGRGGQSARGGRGRAAPGAAQAVSGQRGRGGHTMRGRGVAGRGRGMTVGAPQHQQQPQRVVVQMGQGRTAPQNMRTVVQPQEQQQNRRVLVSANTGSTRVLVSDMAHSTSDHKLRQLASQVGSLEGIQLQRQQGSAILKFRDCVDAASFANRFNRHMLDLSMIKVSILPS